jgi:hypothetical protein
MSNDTIGTIEQQTTEAVGANREALTEELARIRRDEDLSERTKARFSDEATPKAGARHAEIVAEHEHSVSEVLEQNEKRLFRLSYPEDTVTPSQRQAFRDSYRDASFCCLNLPEADLDRILTRAMRTGDRALEHAGYHESIERGLFGVAGQYRERHPDAKAAWETYEKTRLSEESHGAALTKALLSSANPGAA